MSQLRGLVCLFLAGTSLLSACGGSTEPRAVTTSRSVAAAGKPCGTADRAPRYAHVVWVVMENHAYSQIIGSSKAPYINMLAAQCGLAANYRAIAHPSLPNYIAMTSGGTQGVSDDAGPSAHPLAAPSVFSQAGTGGWRALQESMPKNCELRNPGKYAVRHNPAAYYTGIRADCAHQDVAVGATPDLSARFTFVTPNLCNDTHDCPVETGDAWLRAFLARVFRTREYKAGHTAVFLTWDEDDDSSGNHIATLVMAPSVRPGTRSPTAFTHYSLLRTTEELLGLRPLLGDAAHARSMQSAFNLRAR